MPAVMPTYARANIAFARGEGATLIAEDGRRYLDFAGGIAVNALGHCHPHLVKALCAQAGQLWHVSNLYEIPSQTRMAERLVANSFADTVFFANSGAEAVEGAIKIARRFHDTRGNPEKYRVIGMSSAFHGRTLATIAAGDSAKTRKGFDPMPDGFDHVAFGNMNELRAAISPETAAILVEPVQGEGGVRPATLDYLRALRAVADEFGLVLIFDEVQCGFGRTGKLFAHEWAGIVPDVMALAKGIGSGFPLGAILANAEVASAMEPGSHGSTFGGNPLAMAVGNAVLDVMLAPGFIEAVDRIARDLWFKLLALVARHRRIFAEVRGAGLMLGLRCCVPNGDMVVRLCDAGLLTVPAADNVIRLLPPLIIGTAG